MQGGSPTVVSDQTSVWSSSTLRTCDGAKARKLMWKELRGSLGSSLLPILNVTCCTPSACAERSTPGNGASGAISALVGRRIAGTIGSPSTRTMASTFSGSSPPRSEVRTAPASAATGATERAAGAAVEGTACFGTARVLVDGVAPAGVSVHAAGGGGAPLVGTSISR